MRLAAIVGTRAGWSAFQTIRQKRVAESLLWEVPIESTLAVGEALRARSIPVRLNAARLIADFPSVHLLPALRAALTDEVWTVRWSAVAAIAAVAPDDTLLDILLRTQPRDPSGAAAERYRRALAVLYDGGVSLPREISVWNRPVHER